MSAIRGDGEIYLGMKESRQHAVLILAHDSPELLRRLLSRLAHERITVFIHFDRKNRAQYDLSFVEAFGARLYDSIPVHWGSFSIVRATLDLMCAAHNEGPFHSYTLISGKDYPLLPLDKLVQELDDLDENLLHEMDAEKSQEWRTYRYYFNDAPCSLTLNRISHRLAKILPDRKPPPDLPLHFGWHWWTLMDDAVQIVLDFHHSKKKESDWFRYMNLPDEAYFQTVLYNKKPQHPINRNTRRFVQFPHKSLNPRYIENNDLAEALSGRYWFGRKLDAGNTALLDTIDQSLKTK